MEHGAPIERLPGKTLGFAGFGKLPRRTAERLSGFDLEFVADDLHQSADELAEYGVEKVSFDGLLERSDTVSVYTSLTEESILELRETVTRDVARVLDGEAPENPAARDASSG